MSTPTPHDSEGLDSYIESLDTDEAPVLGHLVLYSIFDGPVTRDDLVRWFAELDLDPQFLPRPVRAVDAFEKVTGPDGVRRTYSLNRTSPSRRQDGQDRQATLMVRHVRRDADQLVRHLVREVRDEASTQLSYDTRLGECIFRRDKDPKAEHGAGSLHVEPDYAAINKLPEWERANVNQALEDIRSGFEHQCTYLSGDRLRTVVRTYIEGLKAIRVRPTGGVYFVHRRHARTLAGLRDLVRRFSLRSHLVRVPLADQEEMREMIIAAFTTKAKESLDKLARDIAVAQRTDQASESTIEGLYKRFTELQQAANEHSDLLNNSLDDTHAALDLVKVQLGSLFTAGN